jgi:type I restriction-modification system DNA methylase subunit
MAASADVAALLSSDLHPQDRVRQLDAFAESNGWTSYQCLEGHVPTNRVANGHLVVQEGLQTTAVFTFLKGRQRFESLLGEEKNRVLSVSYNSLADWHLFPEEDGLCCVHNLEDPIRPKRLPGISSHDPWTPEALRSVFAEPPQASLKNLDDALIETIRYWKREMSLAVNRIAEDGSASVLFNSIILIRAYEDLRRKSGQAEAELLLDDWDRIEGKRTARKCLRRALTRLEIPTPPQFLWDDSKLGAFDSLSEEALRDLFKDFYRNRGGGPYYYDFSLISKHALSRIYEHYVSLLRTERPKSQLKLFPDLPEEEANRGLGCYYTPEYIARFFAYFLRNEMRHRFAGIRVADPACGSAVFLRTLMEAQLESSPSTRTNLAQGLQRLLGIDVDPPACNAARLSLSLLHLTRVESLPSSLPIEQAEAIEYIQTHSELRGAFDAVIANPPFIPTERLEPAMRERIRHFLGADSSGRQNAYLAHLKIGMEMVKPGGFICYVLPHDFLLEDSSSRIRKRLSHEFVIRAIADLSNVAVFQPTGVYVILLIAQKRLPNWGEDAEKAIIIRCRDFVGHALQQGLNRRLAEEDFFSVHEVEQSIFAHDSWHLLPPKQSKLLARLKKLPTLGSIVTIRQGFVTGCDDVFIRRTRDVPKDERRVYIPYLRDRDMRRYEDPRPGGHLVFYPYIEGKKIGEELLSEQFPETWRHLQSERTLLDARQPVKKGNCAWWCPVRPRPPLMMLRPKIVVPHLILRPSFCFDASGKYGVSRSPFIYHEQDDAEILQYVLAVLNSSIGHWQILATSFKYDRGYARLEVKGLRNFRIPSPASILSSKMKRIQMLIATLRHDPTSEDGDRELDDLIADLYGLTKSERDEIGLRD